MHEEQAASLGTSSRRLALAVAMAEPKQSPIWRRREQGRAGRQMPSVALSSKEREAFKHSGSPKANNPGDSRSSNQHPAQKTEKVTVCLRIRPLTEERGETETPDGKPVIQAVLGGVTVPAVPDAIPDSPTTSPTRSDCGATLEFPFDEVLDQATGQADVFKLVGEPCVQAAMAGINATIMAYGQTGSGKTYTMCGEDTAKGQGIILRVCKKVMERMEAACKASPESNVQVSYLQIYQEKIQDLLDGGAAPQPQQPEMSPPAPIRAGSHGHQPALQSDPLSAPAAPASSAAAVVPASSPDAGGISPQEGLLPQSPKGPKRQDGSPRAKTPPPSPGTPRGLKVREHPTLGPFVAGLTKRVVSWPGLKAAYEEGQGRRAVGSTGMNTASSRSHAIFTLDINQRVRKEDGTETMQSSSIHLVDLAGSERQSRTGADGTRLKESGAINKSLTLLNNVITQLAVGSKHIPYRDSTLTWLLKESLGGNASTSLIACVSPAWQDLKETLSTLRYASKARKIQNKPAANEDPRDLTVQRLLAEIQELRGQLAQQRPPPRAISYAHTGVQVPEDCAGSSSGTSPKRDSFAFPSAVSSQDQGAVARVSGGGATFRASHVKHSIARTPLAAQKKPDNANMALQAILASSSRPPLTSSIPSPSGHRAHSELLQKVQQTLRPALARPETKPVAESVAQKQPNVPLPFLEPCPSLLRLVPVRKDREPLEHATNVPSPHDGAASTRWEWVQHCLAPGITKIGSKNGDILIDGLQPDHAEILHVPEMARADGSKAAARVSVLLYGGAKAGVNGHPLLRYALLQHGDELLLGADVVFRFFDPSALR